MAPVTSGYLRGMFEGFADWMIAVGGGLAHQQFAVVGHDRGCYVALRMALDFPAAITRLVVMDGVPISEALARCDAKFAHDWWHWSFYAQPHAPERAILADPDTRYRGDPEHMGVAR